MSTMTSLPTEMEVSLPNWIQSAKGSLSKEDYITCAVNVASELTDFLSVAVSESTKAPPAATSATTFPSLDRSMNLGEIADMAMYKKLCMINEGMAASVGLPSSKPVLHLEDILTENVLVTVSVIATPERAKDNLIARSVKIQPKPPTMPVVGNNNTPIANLSSQNNICFALGKVLFEIFSQGEPFLLIDFEEFDDSFSKLLSNGDDSFGKLLKNGDDSFGELLTNGDDSLTDLFSSGENNDTTIRSSTQQPPPKRISSSSSTGNGVHSTRETLPLSTKAKPFLLEKGLPLFICQLVSDLLEAKEGNIYMSDTALVSLEEVQTESRRMKSHPDRFLHDQTCPQKAMDDTKLFTQAQDDLYGRGEELDDLMDIVSRISLHVPTPTTSAQPQGGIYNICQGSSIVQKGRFLVEAAFISGHSGSGKSLITKQIVTHCKSNEYSVLLCNFDRHVSPLSSLVQSVESYFTELLSRQEVDPSVKATIDRITESIVSLVDRESFGLLVGLFPSFMTLFPMSGHYVSDLKKSGSDSPVDELLRNPSPSNSTSSTVGSGRNRRHYLFNILFRSICAGGHPVLLCLEDMQWADAATCDIIGDFIDTSSYDGSSLGGRLLYLGNFRDNEVAEDGFLVSHISRIKHSQTISLGELSQDDINDMLSFKFSLSLRQTRQLAQLVYQKTGGNPMFCVEFLRSIVQGHIMVYSVRERRWVWDDSIDKLLISEGVVELLTKKLKQLPLDVIETLKVVSCVGQMNEPIAKLLDLGHFAPNMLEALNVAVKEGIIEKSGNNFAFSHHLLQESTYLLIPTDEREYLHKRIALILAQESEITSQIIAADQINLCRDLCPEEKEQFAKLNLRAGEHAFHSSSYDQAQRYFEAGISLLDDNRWFLQYSLTLRLFELSVCVSFMDGQNLENTQSRINEILNNSKTIDDSLNARAMLAKFHVSQAQFALGIECILGILIDLGEEIPQDVDVRMVKNEIQGILPLLGDITKDKILALPIMSDSQKKKIMKFIGLFLAHQRYCPLMGMLLSCRMINYTFQWGFCEDALIGFVTVAHAMIQYFDNFDLPKQLNRVAQMFIKKSPSEHLLRARSVMVSSSVNCFVEPGAAAMESTLNGYYSAIAVGDLDNAMASKKIYCVLGLVTGADVQVLQRTIVSIMHEMMKNIRQNKKHGFLEPTMTCLNACSSLIGNENSCKNTCAANDIEVKSNSDLYKMAGTHNFILTRHVLIMEMMIGCYFRDCVKVVNLADEYRVTRKAKVPEDIMQVFYEGLAALNLARSIKDPKWRDIGKKSIFEMRNAVAYNEWNYENMACLLEAEQHYLNKRHSIAEMTYTAAIISSKEHRYTNKEALSLELYGIFLVETKQIKKGLMQLALAVEKYKQWGATKKADDVADFIELVNLVNYSWKT